MSNRRHDRRLIASFDASVRDPFAIGFQPENINSLVSAVNDLQLWTGERRSFFLLVGGRGQSGGEYDAKADE